MAHKNFREKLGRFIEAEKQAGIDLALIDQLHSFMLADTMYWDQLPERRNTLNTFFKELHALLDSELMIGKYGGSILIDSIIVTAFETGYRLGAAEEILAQTKITSDK